MRKLTWLGILLVLAGILLTMGPVHTTNAEAPKNKGLYITPLRQYVNIKAGASQTKSFTVANFTDKPMTVAFAVNAFSVTDYAYDYQFNPPKNDWVKLSITRAKLEPSQSQKITYSITIPPNAPPGGQYYSLFAMTSQINGSLKSQVRAATLLYLTIDGPLIRSSKPHGSHLPRLNFGKQIPFWLDVENTGNVHYITYLGGRLGGPLTNHSRLSASHLLLPNTIRRMYGNIPAPPLPGIYKIHISYETESGASWQRARLIMYLPPWCLAFIALVGLASFAWWQHRPRRQAPID